MNKVNQKYVYGFWAGLGVMALFAAGTGLALILSSYLR
jgi:tetrahydromethanopterin S-methyltransferase subunit B